VLEPAIFGHMEPGGVFSVTRTTYPSVISKGLPVFGYETGARWITIDTPAALAVADHELRRHPIDLVL